MNNGIQVSGVSKTYPGSNSVDALTGITFDIPKGQFVAVLGPSGCGKSTLLRIIAGLISPNPGGSVTAAGNNPLSASSNVGVVFQTHNMLPWRNVEANLRLAAELRGLPKDEIDTRVRNILPVLGLEKFRKNYPHQLSGGMRQRAALGQMLILGPEVLLLDEPFGALDALTRDQLNVELLRLWQKLNKTVLLITHSISEAVFLADRVLVMSERPGRIVADIAINLPRPRDPQTTKLAPEFGQYIAQLNTLMGVG
jgi:NitT/TauT family transport system ATP-binding protein